MGPPKKKIFCNTNSNVIDILNVFNKEFATKQNCGLYPHFPQNTFPPFAKWFRPVLHSPKMRGMLIIISRLRLGHSGLNSTMHIIGKHPTELCDWCGIRETVEHVLIKCNRYSKE